MTARSAIVSAITVFALCCGGCATTSGGSSGDTQAVYLIEEGTGVGTRVDSPSTEARLNRVGFLDPNLNRKIAVQRTNARRTPTNTLEVYAVFRNRTSHNQSIQARTQYFGPDREPNEGPHEWQTVFLPPNGIQTYRTYSRGTTAEYYYIEVMEVQPPR